MKIRTVSSCAKDTISINVESIADIFCDLYSRSGSEAKDPLGLYFLGKSSDYDDLNQLNHTTTFDFSITFEVVGPK